VDQLPLHDDDDGVRARLRSLAGLPDPAFPTPLRAFLSAPITDSVVMYFSFEGVREEEKGGPSSRRTHPNQRYFMSPSIDFCRAVRAVFESVLPPRIDCAKVIIGAVPSTVLAML
jgi:hypothetical protein